MTNYHLHQTIDDAFVSGTAPALEAVLRHRENRINFLDTLVDKYSSFALICTKVNMPGSVKNNELVQTLMQYASEMLMKTLSVNNLEVIYEKWINLETGCELIQVVDGISGIELKNLMIDLEESWRLGRLFDFDVYTTKGAISREDLNVGVRKCLVCDLPSKVCGRNRTHKVEALHHEMKKIILDEGRVTFDDTTG